MSTRLYVPARDGGDYSLHRFDVKRCSEYWYSTLVSFATHNNIQIGRSRKALCDNLSRHVLNNPAAADMTSFVNKHEERAGELEELLKRTQYERDELMHTRVDGKEVTAKDEEIKQLQSELQRVQQILEDVTKRSAAQEIELRQQAEQKQHIMKEMKDMQVLYTSIVQEYQNQINTLKASIVEITEMVDHASEQSANAVRKELQIALSTKDDMTQRMVQMMAELEEMRTTVLKHANAKSVSETQVLKILDEKTRLGHELEASRAELLQTRHELHDVATEVQLLQSKTRQDTALIDQLQHKYDETEHQWRSQLAHVTDLEKQVERVLAEKQQLQAVIDRNHELLTRATTLTTEQHQALEGLNAARTLLQEQHEHDQLTISRHLAEIEQLHQQLKDVTLSEAQKWRDGERVQLLDKVMTLEQQQQESQDSFLQRTSKLQSEIESLHSIITDNDRELRETREAKQKLTQQLAELARRDVAASQELVQSRAQFAQSSADKKQLQKQIDEKERELSEIKLQARSATAELQAQLKAEHDRGQEMVKERQELMQKINRLERRGSATQELHALRLELDHKTEQLQRLHNAEQELHVQRDRNARELGATRTQLLEARNNESQLKHQLEAAQLKLSGWAVKEQGLQRAWSAELKKRKEAEQANHVDRDSLENLLRERASERTKTTNQFHAFQEQLSTLRADLISRASENERLDKELQATMRKLEAAQKQLGTTRSDLDARESETSVYQETIKSIHHLAQLYQQANKVKQAGHLHLSQQGQVDDGARLISQIMHVLNEQH